MNNLIILTSSFPYEGGEQFLETEIKYWDKTVFDKIYILPSTYKGGVRDIPEGIQLLNGRKVKSNISYVFLAILSIYFYREIFYIVKNTKHRNWFLNIKNAIKTLALTFREKDRLSSVVSLLGAANNTIYSYWNDVAFYAACILKKKNIVNKVVSRAHGFDIYEERRNNCYMPIKRQFINDFDKVYLLSKCAVTYYQDIYGSFLDKLAVSRLGVSLPLDTGIESRDNNVFRVLSLSYCVPVKQIHLIMEALYIYAKGNKNTQVVWEHIGDGPLFESLKESSNELMKLQSNFRIDFKGLLSNLDVKKHIESKFFDVFINASLSEGIPVSIMEAMSYRVPAIAPNVGGIADLVNESNGYLMPAECTAKDIIKGIIYIRKNYENVNFRDNAYTWVFDNFNSSINYPDFIREVEKEAGINEA